MDICCDFKALGDPARLKILKLLAKGPSSVGALVGRLGLSQPAVSHHLRVLREAKLVTSRKQGTTVYYALNRKRVTVVCCCLKNDLQAD